MLAMVDREDFLEEVSSELDFERRVGIVRWITGRVEVGGEGMEENESYNKDKSQFVVSV